MKDWAKLILVFIIFMIFATISNKLDFISDDSFIGYRYAKNFVEGNGLVYNAGEVVEGYTTFSWVMLASLFINLNLDPFLYSRYFSFICSLVIFILLYFISENYFNVKFPYNLIAIILLAFNVGFIMWAASGLETIFFTLLIVVSGYYVIKFIETRKTINLYYCSFFLLMCAYTRPEGIYFFVLSFSYLIYFLLTTLKYSFGKTIRLLILPVLVFVILFSIYFIMRYNYYGYLFPNTYYAKSGGNYMQQVRGFYYIYRFVKESLGVGLLLSLPVYLIYKNHKNDKVTFLLVIILGYLSYVIYIGGDGLGSQRFIIPVMPWLFLLIQSGFYKLVNNFRIKKLATLILSLLIIFSSISSTFDFRRRPANQIAFARTVGHNFIKVSEYMKNNLNKDERLAVISAGMIPYYTDFYTIDRLGLNDIHIAHKKMDNMGSGGAGHEKKDDDYVFQFKNPTIFIDEFPTPEKKEKEDLEKFGKIYKFNSINIGEGEFADEYGNVSKADIYFNFYKLLK